MFRTEVHKRFWNITGFISEILSQDTAALYTFYMWRKHKSWLFRKHVKAECLFWHACSPCCLLPCISVFFRKLAPLYSLSAALTESCFKSQHLLKSEPQSTQTGTCTQLLTTYRLAGPLTQLHIGASQLRGRIQLFSASFNHNNKTVICIVFPNALLHRAHTFSIYITASHLITTTGPSAPDEAVPSWQCKSMLVVKQQTEIQLASYVQVVNISNREVSNFFLFYNNIWAKHKILHE